MIRRLLTFKMTSNALVGLKVFMEGFEFIYKGARAVLVQINGSFDDT